MMTTRLLRNLAIRALLVLAVVLAGCSKTVPDVVGQTQNAAIADITGAGLAVGAVKQAYSPTVAPGTVISQIPAGGTGAAAGSAVVLTVSRGPQPVTVPNVVGTAQSAASAAITGAGLTLGAVTQAFSATAASGTVIGQVPVSGTSVSLGTAVSLIVSAGLPPEPVPNVVSETQDAAFAAITGAGFTVGAVTLVFSATVPSDNVISQDPAPGIRAAAGSAVLLTVSKGPAPVTVPSVVNMPQATASMVITGARLVVGAMTQEYSAMVAPGCVISQNPDSGSSVPPGTPVALTVSQGPQPVAIPDVVGMTQAAATEAITGAGLAVGAVTQEYSASVASGDIVSQNPAGGSLALPGGAVALTVSKGPEPVIVPNVVGMAQAEATAAITDAGLTVGALTLAFSATMAPGSIISQNPTGGSLVPPGTLVALTVSQGPQPVTIPDVVGMTQAAATEAVTGAGLAVGAVTREYSASVASGDIVSQNPAGGSLALPGGAVALTVSKGPEPVIVPNVVGIAQAEATAAITDAGLTVGALTLAFSASMAPGSIISQNPTGGSSAPPATAVALIVSEGPQPESGQQAMEFGYGISRQATLMPDGMTVLTGSRDGNIRLWDVTTGKVIRTFAGQTSSIVPVGFIPDGTRILTLSGYSATLWDATTGTMFQNFTDAEGKNLRCAAISPDGTIVFTVSVNTMKLWDTATGAELRTFTEDASMHAESAAFGPDGTKLVTGYSDGTAKLWDTATGAVLCTFTGHTSWVESVAFSPDGAKVLTGSYDDTAKLWDAVTGGLLRTFTGHTGFVNSVTFNADGSKVLTGSEDGTARLWDALTGKLIHAANVHPDHVDSVAFSAGGAKVMTHAVDGTVKLCDAATGVPLQVFTGHTTFVNSVAFSLDGTNVAITSYDALILFDVATGTALQKFVDMSPLTSVAFSPDGTKLVTGCYNNTGIYYETAKLWDAATGTVLRTFTGNTETVWSVAFSPDGTKVLTGAGGYERVWPYTQFIYVPSDCCAKLWDIATGALLCTFNGHVAPVNSVAFSADGTKVLTGTDDGTARLWNALTGTEIEKFTGHTDLISAVAFSPEGAKVLTGSYDGTARLWVE